jgi:hypothetical protein
MIYLHDKVYSVVAFYARYAFLKTSHYTRKVFKHIHSTLFLRNFGGFALYQTLSKNGDFIDILYSTISNSNKMRPPCTYVDAVGYRRQTDS